MRPIQVVIPADISVPLVAMILLLQTEQAQTDPQVTRPEKPERSEAPFAAFTPTLESRLVLPHFLHAGSVVRPFRSLLRAYLRALFSLRLEGGVKLFALLPRRPAAIRVISGPQTGASKPTIQPFGGSLAQSR